MKSLILFALFIGFSLATYNPQWVVSNPYNNLYKPTNVTATSEPMVFHFETVTICGEAQGDFNVLQFHYEIIYKNVTYYSGNQDLTEETVKAGTDYCFDFKFLVPSLAKPGFTLRMTLESPDDDICAVDVYMPF